MVEEKLNKYQKHTKAIFHFAVTATGVCDINLFIYLFCI